MNCYFGELVNCYFATAETKICFEIHLKICTFICLVWDHLWSEPHCHILKAQLQYFYELERFLNVMQKIFINL